MVDILQLFQSQQDLADRKESEIDHAVTVNDSDNSGSGKSSPIPVAINRCSGDGVDFYYA
jgi:hypothetical protein